MSAALPYPVPVSSQPGESLIGRYPRYAELFEAFQGVPATAPESAEKYFLAAGSSPTCRCFRRSHGSTNSPCKTKSSAELVRKGATLHSSTTSDLVIRREQRGTGQKVLPAHAAAAQTGSIELSTSPFLPSYSASALPRHEYWSRFFAPGLPLPQQTLPASRGCARPALSAGSICTKKFSAFVRVASGPRKAASRRGDLPLRTASASRWMATGEGVLRRSSGASRNFLSRRARPTAWPLGPRSCTTCIATKIDATHMNMVFRDHTHFPTI